MSSTAVTPVRPLQLLSVVIPARDEEACVASTVEHLYVELRLHQVPHEIIVVDDGSSDTTRSLLQTLTHRIPTLRPVQNPAPNGFGRSVARGFDHMTLLVYWSAFATLSRVMNGVCAGGLRLVVFKPSTLMKKLDKNNL